MDKKIAITTDSNSGVMPTEGNEFGLFTLSMPFIVNGQVYLENIDLSSEEFYTQLLSDADISTSQPSAGEVIEFWRKVLSEYDEIVHIPTSSFLSAAYYTAENLAKDEEFAGRVHLVDNRRMSITLKESVYDAVKLRDQGFSATEIKQKLEEARLSAIYFAVDTMKFLKKGGRITPAAATIGTILRLKPILQIQGEKINKFAVQKNTKQALETMKKAITNDLNTRFKEYAEKGEVCMSVAFSQNEADAKLYMEQLKTLFPNMKFRLIDPVSLSIACHTGPNVIGVSISRCFN
ncbi:MAG: DegV family protein [Clostridia bacterium]|nr:DegV family protein [Clostridia bacterium]